MISCTDYILRVMRVNATFQLRHPNILKIIDTFLNYKGQFVIVRELAESSLEEYIKRRLIDEKKPLNNSEVAFIMLQLLEGLEYIHNSGFIHRDITPDNLFVFNDGIIKIGNFDIAIFGKYSYEWAGIPKLMAPEIDSVPEFPYDNKVDIWSLGLVFYFLMTGKKLEKHRPLYQSNGPTFKCPEQYSQFQEILSKMTKMKPDLRPTIQELKSEFLKLIWDRQQYNNYQSYIMNHYFNEVKSSVENSINSDDRYLIEDQISRGGFGSVYKAKDLKDEINKVVAFKKQDLSILNYRKGEDLSIEVLRIMREIATFQLKHPNIVEILDSYLTIESQFIIISELAKYDLTEFKKQKGQMSYSDISTIMIQLLEALEEIHCKGFTHRDINPQNVLVFDNDIVKICDFGVASFGTQTAARAGKEYYMAPEVLSLEPYDKSVDIWSLGILLYYLYQKYPI
ncbi:serine threonine-protein kinase fused-like [Stylonychia lemnae]|uniref:Serine threonine-protein kinase fused-like n=1 Tax=Stylonychia lemnae TaxID=5949 RepID=A0A078A2R1_STYLE|nr:serine threonine-protein kinase fused-like [Stylonychia lemnae]|eukprot:CDW76558.1 serine threonine-protein kinase fused-like [Stylonychia lemnae]